MTLPQVNTAEHTEGPWEHSGDGIWAKSPWNARVRLATITTFSDMNGINCRANAKLVAAAPELLAALTSLLAFTRFELDGDMAERKPWVTLIAKAEAAVSKATGTP